MKSEPYELHGKLFRFDFERCQVEHVYKATEEEVSDDAKWRAQHDGASLLDIGPDGYGVITTVGLSAESWGDEDARKEYLTSWVGDLEEECAALLNDFIKNELPLIEGGE